MQYAVILIILFLLSFTNAQATTCIYDVNGNGTLEQGEFTTCNSTPQGDLCPLRITACNTQCPAGSTLDQSSSLCIVDGTMVCPSGMQYDVRTDKCVSSPTLSCPAGYTLQGRSCVAQPTYQDVVVYSQSGGEGKDCDVSTCGLNINTLAYVFISQGESIIIRYNTYNVGCGGINNDSHYAEITKFGQILASWDNGIAYICTKVLNMCVTVEYNEACSGPSDRTYEHVYNSNTMGLVAIRFARSLMCQHNNCTYNLEVIHRKHSCPDGGMYNTNSGLCVADPQTTCPQGSVYDDKTQKCISDPQSSCPQGFSYNSNIGKCTKTPDMVCPYGSQYQCMQYQNEWKCSDIACSDVTNENTDTDMGANDQQNDGWDQQGNCQGSLYIFSGRDLRCRPPGTQTGFSDCCKKDKTWFGMGQCEDYERILAKLRTTYLNQDYTQADANCHYIGEYCAERWRFPGGSICVQKKKTFCCFSSPLARIIQEGGRAQLGISWGSPESPNCRGLTLYEFQKIDFSRIDFSEWINQIVGPNITSNISNSVTNAINNLKQNLQNMSQ